MLGFGRYSRGAPVQYIPFTIQVIEEENFTAMFFPVEAVNVSNPDRWMLCVNQTYGGQGPRA
jgi:hypothetical protein